VKLIKEGLQNIRKVKEICGKELSCKEDMAQLNFHLDL